MSEYLAYNKNVVVFLSLILLTFCIGSAYAKTIKIGVEGMVCDFCAQSIEKVFLNWCRKVDVNLDRKSTVKIDVFQDDEDGISDERIKQLFLDAGYDVSKIERD